MSAFKLAYLICDGCDGEEFDGAERLVSTLRQQAKAEGWLVGQPGGRDFCPSCRDAR